MLAQMAGYGGEDHVDDGHVVAISVSAANASALKQLDAFTPDVLGEVLHFLSRLPLKRRAL